MTQRERFLSIIVGGSLVCLVIWWGFGKYRSAVNSRMNQITSLQNEKERLTEQKFKGEYANRQMGEYMARSLPGNKERAQSNYQQWLLNMVQAHDLSDRDVDFNNSRPIRELYQRLDFSVRGRTDMTGFIDILHAFYAKDYLHRIRSLTLRPNREGDFSIELMIDAIALLDAGLELPSREETAWKVDQDIAAYRDPIMNRNFFQPPNAAPEYTGRSEVEAIVGRESPIPLTFSDAEGHSLRYEFVELPPEFIRLDRRSGTLRIKSDEKGEFDVVVRAIDDGYPRRSTEQKLLVKVVDPPPPPLAAPPKLAFDDASQTVLTALVHGRDEWTAWMHVRTRDTTLHLQVGDTFDIGSLKGKVVDVTPRFVMLEIDGRRFTLKPAGNLSEAAKRAQDD
jgi:hypothetical protein